MKCGICAHEATEPIHFDCHKCGNPLMIVPAEYDAKIREAAIKECAAVCAAYREEKYGEYLQCCGATDCEQRILALLAPVAQQKE